MLDILLESYRTEYETTDITIPQLLAKYNIYKKDLKGYTKWKKQEALINKETFEDSQQTTLANAPATSQPPLDTDPTDLTMLDKIERFKEAAIDRALRFIEFEAQFAEVKEFKDIVAIVDSIEKSYIKANSTDTQPQINILIQNLMQNFKDDC